MCTVLLSLPLLAAAVEPVRIGVLAYRGTEAARVQWAPLAEQLSSAMPEYRFQIAPYALSTFSDAVAEGSVDLVLTNPGHYVLLESQHGVTRIATIKKSTAGAGSTSFGAVIIARSDRDDIKRLEHLRGKSFAAVSEHAFGGFQMAWRELVERDIDPFKDFKRIDFLGFPQDDIVLTVLKGFADAGTVRTGVLEQMAAEGQIRLQDFRVLNRQHVSGFGPALSTRLYPEWPLAKAAHVPDRLVERIVVALLTEESALPGISWTIPQDYSPVHELMRDLSIGPYKPGSISPMLLLRRYWGWLASGVLLILVLGVATVLIGRSNQKLMATQRDLREEISRRRTAQHELSQHRDNLEQLVSTRTEDLRRVNLLLEEDIIARKRAEQALRHSDHTLRKLHFITSAPETPFEEKIVALLNAGCGHFGLGLGLLTAFSEQGGEIIEAVSTTGSDDADQDPVAGQDFCDAIPRPTQPVGVTDARASDWHGSACLLSHGWSSYLGACVHVAGEPYGSVSFLDRNPREVAFTDFDLDIVQLIADWIGWEMDRYRAQEQSRKHLQDLAHVSRLNTMGEMASGMAHEINQPLTAIVNYARGSIRRLGADKLPMDELTQVLNNTAQEAERAAQIIKRLRQLVSKDEYPRTRVAITTVLGRALDLMAAELRENQVSVRKDIAEDLAEVEIDPVQIEQVLINLLRNAVDAMKQEAPDSRIIRLQVSMSEQGQMEVAVEDSGCGLPQNEDIFTPFFSTKEQGMGMGLSISRTIIESHGGVMRAGTGADGCTRISFTLPVAEL